MITTPYWLEGTGPTTAPLRGEHHADVVVVGGGLCGAGAALALGEAGVNTAWLEARSLSWGASGRNAGFILQGTAERYSRAIGLMGRERARAVHELTRRNHALMRESIERLGIDCGYLHRGSLQLAGSEEEEGDLLESAAALNADGFRATVLEGDALDACYREAGFRIGVHLPDDGELNPARFVRAVGAHARGLGVALFEESPVTRLDAPSPGEVVAHTAEGAVHASLALVCTNAAAGQLLPWFADKVDPVRGQMLATAPAPPTFRCPVYADHGFDYWRQDEFGRVVLGGWRNLDVDGERGFDETLHDGIQARMEAFLQRFPSMRGVPITHRWSGIMGFSRDGLPLAGAVPGMPGALAAVGFTGHGFGFAFLAGRSLAEVALHGRSEFTDLLAARRLQA